MHYEAQSLRRAVAEYAEGRAARSVRYGSHLRQRVIDFERWHGGEVRSVGEVARMLSVTLCCLYRCLTTDQSESASRVRKAELVPVGASQGLVMLTPAGLRVEGLTLHNLVALLRTLR